jgi:hypothetical protein
MTRPKIRLPEFRVVKYLGPSLCTFGIRKNILNYLERIVRTQILERTLHSRTRLLHPHCVAIKHKHNKLNDHR